MFTRRIRRRKRPASKPKRALLLPSRPLSEQRLELLDDLHVGRQPVDAVELVGREPLRRLMFDETDLSLHDGRKEAVHREVKLRIVALDRRHDGLRYRTIRGDSSKH